MGSFIDLTRKRFGRLTVTKRAANTPKGATAWECYCSCDKTITVLSGNLIKGLTKSCGCYRKDIASQLNVTHGKYKTLTYKIWSGVHYRCNSNDPNYGGRGIQVCKRWNKFENFFEDMGKRPAGFTLKRIDVNKDYSKNNCAWTAVELQQRNRRDTKLSVEKANLIRLLRAQGHLIKEITVALETHQSNVSNVLYSNYWK